MHPYQEQVDRMWELIKLRNRALKNEFWIEAVDLTYIILEVELILLLTSQAGEEHKPLLRSTIDKAEYLKSLADLACKKSFIDGSLHKDILSFNDARRKMTHRLIQGEIEYSQLETVCKGTTNIVGKIQSLWLPITIGQLETQ